MSRLKNDLLDKVFGKLTVIERAPNRVKSNVVMWLCVCECGNKKVIQGSSLSSGNSTSCGCEKGNILHNMSDSPEFSSWAAAKGRVTNPSNQNWDSYGARGIKMSQDWLESFETFFQDMGARPEGTSLDRIDPNGDYSKENCRWANKITQAFNQRKRKNNKSGRTGVFYNKNTKNWLAMFMENGKRFTKSFKSYEEAVKYREEAELRIYGEVKHEAQLVNQS